MLKLKRIYDNETDIPEGAVGLYEKNGEGKFVLSTEIEGLTSIRRTDEFRTANLKLKTRLEAYEDAEYGGGEMTPERVTELVGKEKTFTDAGAKTAEEIERRVNERTAEAQKNHEKEKRKLEHQLADITGKLQSVTIESKAVEAAIPFGLRKTAHEDLIDRVLKVFKIDDKGQPVAYQSDGKTVRYGTDPDKPLTITEFVKSLATDSAKHLFEDNEGTHADPSKSGSRQSGGGDDSAVNYWNPDTYINGRPNMTEQNKLIRRNPDLAVKHAAKHGVKLEISEADRQLASAGK